MLKSVFFVIFLQEMTTIVVVGKLLFKTAPLPQ